MAFLRGAQLDEISRLAGQMGDHERDLLLAVARKLTGKGRRKYGEWDPATDKRDLRKETEEELVDGLVYMLMESRRGRTY